MVVGEKLGQTGYEGMFKDADELPNKQETLFQKERREDLERKRDKDKRVKEAIIKHLEAKGMDSHESIAFARGIQSIKTIAACEMLEILSSMPEVQPYNSIAGWVYRLTPKKIDLKTE